MNKEEVKRRKNLAWTLSDDYLWQPQPEDLKDRVEAAFYPACEHLFFEEPLLYSFHKHLALGFEESVWRPIWDLGLLLHFAQPMEEEFPGLQQRLQALQKMRYARFRDRGPRTVQEELTYAYLCRKRGQVPKTTRAVLDLLDGLMALEGLRGEDYLLAFEALIKKHFVASYKSEEAKKQFDRDEAMQKWKKHERPEEVELEVIHSAEFSTVEIKDEGKKMREKKLLRLEKQKPIHSRDAFLRMQSYFGKSILKENERKQLERTLCTDIHRDSRLLVTRGQYGNGIEEEYRKRLQEEQVERNRAYYKEREHLAEREITTLSNFIQRTLQNDLEDSQNRALQGQFVTGRVYRGLYLNDNKLFKQNSKEERGQLSIFLLIDSSASQKPRSREVSFRAYLLAEAFVRAGIPTHISSYQNVDRYLIHKIYRTPEDPKSANRSLFEYMPAGSNRDGLAIRLLRHTVLKSGAKHPLIIVLSDGKPNDVRPAINRTHQGIVRQYKEDFAVYDTAQEVRITRQYGIPVFSVFTGEEKDIPAMRKIYGSHFAAIEKLERLTHVLGKYLKFAIEESMHK